ncbi:VirB4 family type IV secretion system protein [Alicyclobacillus macrosporangiidus]|uniref:TraG P-loop domain-containing protein n=1 Tax=Alicyclobacillus macrosporangiidus TaxID=392015 RepID=A0A1I7KCT0_9BACL|nr:DUF87 domain-containing protein [Alicyclobacillus macrosporangiidus]SFU95271.1 protein of unknown function DUF87 [Alicyclobacillus macrosporangiidus]
MRWFRKGQAAQQQEKPSKRKRDSQREQQALEEVWGEHAPTLQDVIATASQAQFRPTYVEIAPNSYRRTYVVTRMPNRVHFGFLNQFFRFGADVDVSVHIEPADSARQIRKITQVISGLEAQIAMDIKADRTENVTFNRRRIEELDSLRAALQAGEEKMYYLTVVLTVSAESLPALERACATLEREGPGRGFQLLDAAYLQQEGLLTVSPLGINKLRFPMEVFGSYVANMFPFTSSQFSHRRGPLVGFDLVSGAPMFYDAWHDGLTNANMFVCGVSGAGKSYFLKMLISHSVLHDIQTVVIDWEGEYPPLAKALGGAVVTIDYDAPDKINPCELEEEEYIDPVTGQKKARVDIAEKIDEMTNFTRYAASLTGSDDLTGAEIALINRLWEEIYRKDFRFTEDPNSLYDLPHQLQGQSLQMRRRRKQPQFSDFYQKLRKVATADPRYQNLADRLERVTAGKTLGLFDCQSTLRLAQAPIVVFDLSRLSENSDLRKLGMYVALEWIIERFIKKNPGQKKRVLVDEAQEALKNREGTPAGNQAALFLDTSFTRIRKRGGSAVAASQQFRVFAASEYGASIIRNSATKCLLRQDRQDAAALRELFSLADHELEQLFEFERGQVRWDVGGEIVYSYYQATPAEDRLWSTKVVAAETEGVAD